MQMPSSNWMSQFGRFVAKANLFSQKSCPSHPGCGVRMGKFSSRLHKNRDLGNRTSMVAHMNTSNFFPSKERRGEISESELARLNELM